LLGYVKQITEISDFISCICIFL